MRCLLFRLLCRAAAVSAAIMGCAVKLGAARQFFADLFDSRDHGLRQVCTMQSTRY